METEGKPISPPAPVNLAPRLLGVNLLVGAMLVDLGPMNDRLSQTGYPNKLPLAFPIMGGQGFGLFSRFLIGGSGAGLFTRSVSGPNNTDVGATGGWGTFDFGYQLIRINGFLLAPILSFGGYGLTLNVASKADTSFNDALRNPTRATTLTSNGLLGGFSVLANLIVLGRRGQLPGARAGLAVGLRVGALYGLPYRDWQADGAHASDGPTFGLRGGYAALSLGVGTW